MLEHSYQLLLELKLRRVSGNSFQDFFSDIMEVAYCDDYVRVKPYGQIGDKGCDGYLKSSGSVYACYGAQNGATGSVSKFLSKMTEDFGKAKSNLGEIMKSWRMVHNIVEGLPVDAVQRIAIIEKENPSLEISVVGQPSIAKIMETFPEHQLEKFLGRKARNEDFRSIQMSEVKDLVDAIVLGTPTTPMTEHITPVSPEKITINKIPDHWSVLLQAGRANEHRIQDYFNQHRVPTRGETLASIFRNRYSELVAEKLPPSTIMYWLYHKIVGPEELEPSRQVAAYTLLAYLFERCDIFENAKESGKQ